MQRWSGWAVVAALAVILVACSGDNNDVTIQSSTSATPSGGGRATPPPSRTPADDFADALRRLETAQYRVTYTFTSLVTGQEFVGALTWVRANDGRERVETSSEQGDEKFQLVLIRDVEGEQITCFAAGGFDRCFRGNDGPFADLQDPTQIIFAYVVDADQVADVRLARPRQILGLDTVCYEVEAAEGNVEACVGAGGVLLYAAWSGPDGDGGGLEASAFSTEVDDEDFEPTGPFTDG